MSSGGSGSTVDYSEVNYYDEEAGMILSKSMSVKFEDSVYIPTKKGVCSVGGYSIEESILAKILGYIYQDLGTDKTFYFLTPSQIKTRKLDERHNWTMASHVIDLIKELGVYHSETINNIRNQHQIGANYKLKDVFKKTKTNNRAKEIILMYEEYHNSVEKNYNKMDDVWNICRNLGMRLHEANPNIDYKERFEKSLNAEIKKYPILGGNVLSTLWSSDQQQIVADYIDMIEENSTKELTTL